MKPEIAFLSRELTSVGDLLLPNLEDDKSVFILLDVMSPDTELGKGDSGDIYWRIERDEDNYWISKYRKVETLKRKNLKEKVFRNDGLFLSTKEFVCKFQKLLSEKGIEF